MTELALSVQQHDDEIDLIDLILMLWRERLVIGFFLVVGCVVGGVGALAVGKTYETNFTYRLYGPPSFWPEVQVHADIGRKFYDRNTFSRWKAVNQNSPLDFPLIRDPKIVDGSAFERKIEDRFIAVSPELIVVKSKNANLIREVSDYLMFVSVKVSEDYRAQAKKTSESLTAAVVENFGAFEKPLDSAIGERIISMEEYLANELDLIKISNPMIPVVTSQSQRLVFAVSLVIGGLLGVIFVLVRTAIRRRNAAIKEASS